ncbi:hypothetical protein I6E46_06645 [Prevotella loescheii]|nr:hypothetical protein [Hoylesella loescheii]
MSTKKRLVYHEPTISIIEIEEYKLLYASGAPSISGTIIRGDDITGETSISGDAKQQFHPDLWSSDTDSPYWPIDNDE